MTAPVRPAPTPPSFSVAMATYNGGRHLRAQLDSIAAQTLPPIELQVGDDGSTDDTRRIVEDFASTAPFPVRFHRNEVNLGYGQNFLETARRCSGDWIAFSDQDDVWLPGKLQRCGEALAAAGDAEIMSIAHRARVVDDQLNPTGAFIPEEARDCVAPPLSHELTWSHYGFAQLFRRELISEIEPWPRVPTKFTDIDRYPHDVWISSLSNLLGNTLHLPDALCLYRRHAATVTQTAKDRAEGRFSALFSTGATHYRHMAAVCREAAECVDFHARYVVHAGWSDRLLRGREAYLRLAQAYERRASVYSGEGFGRRLAALAELTFDAGYFGLGASSFGPRSMVKDLMASAVPGVFRRQGAEA